MMPTKERYQSQKLWESLEIPKWLSSSKYQPSVERSLQETESMHRQVLDRQGRYWAANNGNKGNIVANATVNKNKHAESVARAKELISPYAGSLGTRGTIKRISIDHNIPESTVRRYIKLYKENSQDQ